MGFAKDVHRPIVSPVLHIDGPELPLPQLPLDLPNSFPCRSLPCFAIDPLRHRLVVATDVQLPPCFFSEGQEQMIQFPCVLSSSANVSEAVISSSRGLILLEQVLRHFLHPIINLSSSFPHRSVPIHSSVTGATRVSTFKHSLDQP